MSEPSVIHEQLRLSVYQVARTPYARLDAHIQHRHWAISHVRAGDVRTVTRGIAFAAPAGTLMIHPPDLPYREEADGPGEHEWVVFDAALAPLQDLFRVHAVAPVVPLKLPGEFSRTFEQLLGAWAGPDGPLRPWRVFGLVAQLLGQALESWRAAGAVPRPAALATPPDRLTDLVGYMAEHLAERLTRADLAARLCVHPGSLDRLFRRAHGVAPMRALRDLRLARARQWLEGTDATLEAIAAACGFEDAAYLSRVFRQRFGQTPGAYRRGVESARRGYTGLLPPPGASGTIAASHPERNTP